MEPHLQAFRGSLQCIDYLGVSPGGKIICHVIGRCAFTAQRSGYDDQIANLHMLLQRAATSDADQRLGTSTTKNFGGNRRVRSVAPAISDGYSLSVQNPGVHLVIQE